MALWKASGGKFKLDFRPWHGGRQGGNLNKELEFRSNISSALLLILFLLVLRDGLKRANIRKQ